MSYKGKPGDLWNASTLIAGVTTNGNGNDTIDNFSTTYEQSLSFYHLANANLITGGNYSNSSFATSNIKTGPFGGYYYFNADPNNANNVIVVFAQVSSFTQKTNAALSPNDAYVLDRRYDDGVPTSGNLIANDGSNTTGGCLSSGQYKNSTVIGCYIYVIIDRQGI
jgi:hypothetical protein